MNAKCLLCLLGTATFLSSGSIVMAQSPSEEVSCVSRAQAIVSVERAAKGFMRRHRVQGLSIAVVDSRGPIWLQGFGRADRRNRRAFTEDTQSLPGSVSKMFTATAVMILVDRGLVDLDAPVVRYLPDLAIRTDGWPIETITVRSLLTHHSGLPSDRFRGMVTDTPPGKDAETASALPALLRDDFAPRPPNAAFAYSNLGFSLLGDIVERVGERPFAQFVRQEIFEPLGMADSSFVFGEPERQRAARGYREGREQLVPYLRDVAAGGMLTTARDMGRFLSAMLAISKGQPGILRPETLASMWTRQNGGVAEDLDFSIGLGSMTLEDLALAAARSFAASERGVQLPASPAVTTDRRIPSALQSAVSGDWTTMAGLLRIRPVKSGLRVNLAGKWFDAVLRSDGRLGLEARLLGIKLPVAELGEYSLSAETVDGEGVLGFRGHGILLSVCHRVRDTAVDSAWKARVGPWKIPASEAGSLVQGVELKMDDAGRLLLRYRFFGNPRPREYPLETLSASRARLMGSGRSLGESLVVEGEGPDQRLIWSGFHLTR
jgi:CubicO group peptidase (beta-lactamase class C family)